MLTSHVVNMFKFYNYVISYSDYIIILYHLCKNLVGFYSVVFNKIKDECTNCM